MTTQINSVRISVGAVVLDRPDGSGEYIAKDLAGGWAYIVADNEGDNRYRGQGSCDGGVAAGLRYAFISAVGCVPECQRITVCVDTPQDHKQMVRLATGDAQVVTVIANRPVLVMTRPQERSAFQVRLAAERAASVALRAREQRQVDEAPVIDAPAVPELRPGWRHQRSARVHAGPSASIRQATSSPTPTLPPPAAAPRTATTAPHELLPARSLAQWLRDLDNQVEQVQTDLQDLSR